jgi:hypothetical protein
MRAMLDNPEMLQRMMDPANMQAIMQMQQAMQQLQGSGLMPSGIPGMPPPVRSPPPPPPRHVIGSQCLGVCTHCDPITCLACFTLPTARRAVLSLVLLCFCGGGGGGL